MDDFPQLTIGEVAARAGIATSQIRYYESIGLLPAPARTNGQRRYDTDVLGRLAFIGVAQSAGFKLREIREIIDGIDAGAGMAEPMRELSRRKLDEVEALLKHARTMKGWLEVARECGCVSPEECSLFPGEDATPEAVAEALTLVKVEGKSCRRAPGPSRPG